MGIEMIIGSVVFLTIIFVIVLVARRHTKNLKEYLTGNHNVGGIVSGFTWTASAASAGLFLGAAGLAYQFGWPGLMYLTGVFGSMFFTWQVIIPRLRRVAENVGIITTADYLAIRFNGEVLKLLSSFWTIIFVVPMIIIQFMGAGYLLEANLGISYIWGMVLIGIVVAISTQMGGYLGVAWLDTAQGIIMTIGTVIMVIVSMRLVGGFVGLNQQLAAINTGLVEFTGFMPLSLQIGLIVTFLVSFWGQPHLAARVWGLKDAKAVRVAFPLSMGLATIWAFGAGLIGLSARVLYPGLAAADLAMPTMISELPAIYTVPLFFALVSAMMTTANSLLLTVGGSIGKDLLNTIFTDIGEATQLKVTKVSVLAIGILSFVVALKPPALILQINAFAFGGFALIFGIPLLIGVLWKRANFAGVLVALVASPVIYILWKLFLVKLTGIHEMIGALIVSIPLVVIVTYLGTAPTTEMEKLYAMGKTPKSS